MLSNRPPRAVLYLRVSTPQQVNEGNSLDVQDQALHAKAEREGWDVVRVFSDEGFSAHDRDTQRIGIEDAVACAERHLSIGDFFGVYNISRFSRRTSHGSQLRDRLEAAGIVIVDVNMYYDYSPLGSHYQPRKETSAE
jgi:site-specific DNA recombinase